MKKLRFIPLFLMAIALITTSCAIDDDDPVVGREIITKTVSLVDTAPIVVSQSVTPYNLPVTTDTAFGTDALVEYDMGAIQGSGIIEASDSQGDLMIDVSEPGTYELSLTNVSVLNKPDYVDVVIGDNNKVTVVVVPYEIPGGDPNALQVYMTWNNMDVNDLDLWVLDDALTTVFETSQSITPVEDISFSNSYPDGMYSILVRDWASADAEVNVTMVVIHPDGTIEAFLDHIDAGTDFNYFVKFDKVGSTYTLTQVPAEPI
ncbi:hypothetical protein [Urechidicola sp. KH5]